MVLRFRENNGKLTGTTTHFRMRVIGRGAITGSHETADESPLIDLKVWGSDLGFTWDGDSRLQAVPAKFMLQGTQRALLVLILTDEKRQAEQQIMKDSPGASGFNPVISLRRATEPANKSDTENHSAPWEATFMARLINVAEAQYKFSNGHYADYHTLIVSGQLKETNGHEFTISPKNLESETDPLPGYRLRLLVLPDGSSYQLSIREKTEDCGVSVFTDETGVILEGRPAECPANSK
ncbi:MAG TPA: hypothetical protein VFK06_17080 [Candidatus Angelobacter sp.]|nr:hypothetical protein [Candidatus Angelobacter sp.]